MKASTYKTFHHFSARIRAYFGLSQDDLAQFIGVSRAQVAQVETGRCEYGSGSFLRLMDLCLQAPPPLGAGPEEEAPAKAVAPDTALLRQRLRQCAHAATMLGRTLEKAGQPACYARRWERALPALEAELPADPADDNRQQQRQRRWMAMHTANMAELPYPGASTRLRLMALRLRYLEAEAAELRQWLAQADEAETR